MDRRDVLFFFLICVYMVMGFGNAIVEVLPTELSVLFIIALMGPVAALNVFSKKFRKWAYFKVGTNATGMTFLTTIFVIILSAAMLIFLGLK